MSSFSSESISKAQFDELDETQSIGLKEEFHKLLESYTGIVAKPYTAYQYYDENGNYIGDSNDVDLMDLLRSAYIEVKK